MKVHLCWLLLDHFSMSVLVLKEKLSFDNIISNSFLELKSLDSEN